jgi:hypothetical protein
MPRKKLPIGIQTFSKIRNENCYYVDKTAYLFKLVNEGSHYFLSRPRRFGKSLLIDTLAELFQANQSLFKGLYIHDLWDWTIQYCVIRISFGGGIVKNSIDLKDKIQEQLDINQQLLNIDCGKKSQCTSFGELIRRAHEKTHQPVVILIDEYDKPILDNLTQPEQAKEIRDGLRNFYSIIKDNDAYLKFVMLTGVSKFSKVSIFSGLNNLNDITLDLAYSAICGYTDHDIETVFQAELEGLDREEIRRWYNGYNWTGESVYNPFDVLLLFDKREFNPYWFETGTPTFLIDFLIERQAELPTLGQLETDIELLSSFDISDLSIEALMFQSGYLTIAKVERCFGEQRYQLRYPNQEVYQSLANALLKRWSGGAIISQKIIRQKNSLGKLLLENNFDGMKALFTAFFASIPHDWYRNNPIAQYEGYYASVFYAYFASLGLEIILEDVTNHGRIDMTVKFNEHVYLFEFKVVEIVPEGKAIEQLKSKNYAQKYQSLNQPIHLIGIEFSKEQRSVVGFDVQM